MATYIYSPGMLQKLEADLQRAAEQAMELTVDDAKRRSRSHRRLRDSIEGMVGMTGGMIRGQLIAHAPYAAPVEYGSHHKRVRKNGGTSTWDVPPRPFIRPAAARFVDRLREAL